jgi:hypothetical protein
MKMWRGLEMPYAGHANLITPDDHAVLWRYLDFAKFMDLIERRKLWFSRADKFEDPLEGTFTHGEVVSFRSLQLSASPELRGWATAPERIPPTTRATTFVNCWREGKFESMAMWDIYGKGSGVVAIKSTVGLLKEAFATYQWNVLVSRVKYIDWNDAGWHWDNNGLTLCCRKDISYSHESEVRAIIWGLEPQPKGGPPLVKLGPDMTQIPTGQEVEVDPARLITEVIVGPREQTRIYNLLELIMKRYGLPQPVRASDLLKGRI